MIDVDDLKDHVYKFVLAMEHNREQNKSIRANAKIGAGIVDYEVVDSNNNATTFSVLSEAVDCYNSIGVKCADCINFENVVPAVLNEFICVHYGVFADPNKRHNEPCEAYVLKEK